MNKSIRSLAATVLIELMFVAVAHGQNEVVLFDFEEDASIAGWTAFRAGSNRENEPAPKVELSDENATSGSRSMKLTFSAGRFPGISTADIPGEWKPPLLSFHADVAASRDCVVMFRAVPQRTKENPDPKAEGAVYVKLARLKPGMNHVEDLIGYGAYGSISAKHGPVVQFDIVLHDAREGEVLFVDNIRLSPAALKNATPFRQKTVFNLGEQPKDYPAYLMPEMIRVLGEEPVKSVMELAERKKEQWIEPTEKLLDEVEMAFKAEYERLKEEHPGAVMARLRDGERGFDPANPDRPYDGWQDAYLGAQAPMSLSYKSLGRGNGKDSTIEFAFRHRCPIYRVDVSNIPAGSDILRAQLVLTRIVPPDRKQLEGNYRSNSPFKPTFWVAEACNRPWQEAETNGYHFAADRYWNETNGMDWGSDDPDFLPTIIAHGPSGLTVTTWDFTNAVRYWTDGKNANHGFCFYPVRGYLDFGRFWSREQKDPKRRPMMMVIYLPR